MTLARLAQPRREWYSTDQEFQWNDILWRKLGQAGFDALINSENITGILETENLVIGAAFNVTNDATADSTDIDATNTTSESMGRAESGQSGMFIATAC
jgi:hypothetical protein